MKRVERHVIKPSHKFFNEAERLAFASKNLYNTVMYTVRQSFIYGHGVPSWGKLDKWFQSSSQYKALPAKVSQLVIKQVSDAWNSYFKALAAYNEDASKFTGKPKLPSYKDKDGRNLVKFNDQAVSKKLLALGIAKLSGTCIELPTVACRSNLIESRIVPKDSGYYIIEIVYELRQKEFLTKKTDDDWAPLKRVASMDLGLDNLATVTFNFLEQPIAINGKPLKSTNQWWNKQVARLRGLLPITQKSSKRIENITRKRNNKVDTYLHQSSQQLVDELVRLKIEMLVIGKNAQWKTEINLGRRNNQNFVTIPYNKFIQMVTYKCEAVGITVIVHEESYTSQASFLDWDNIPIYDENVEKPTFSGKRVKRAWYKASDQTPIHADVNGAFNIGRKVIPTAYSTLKEMVARDRGCRAVRKQFLSVVVHPRRITAGSRGQSRTASSRSKPTKHATSHICPC